MDRATVTQVVKVGSPDPAPRATWLVIVGRLTIVRSAMPDDNFPLLNAKARQGVLLGVVACQLLFVGVPAAYGQATDRWDAAAFPSFVASAVTLTVTALVTYVLRARRAGRCSRCGRRIAGGTAARSCLGGHKLHQTCVDYAMNREVCPICGIYVDHSERRGIARTA